MFVHAEALEPKLAFVTVDVVGSRLTGTRVTSDLAELTTAELGRAPPFDPGEHFFQVSGPGLVPHRVDVTLESGERRRVQLLIERQSARPVRTPSASRTVLPAALRAIPRSHPTLQQIGIGFEGAALAFLATSLAAGTGALVEKSRTEDDCDAAGCSFAGGQAAARGDALATLSTATFVAAVVTSAVGVAMLIAGKPKAAPRVATSKVLVIRY